MKKYNILFSKQAHKDIKKLTPKLKDKVKELCRLLSEKPYTGKPLLGDMKGFFSIRLTYKDRILYSIDGEKLIIYVVRVKSHYGD